MSFDHLVHLLKKINKFSDSLKFSSVELIHQNKDPVVATNFTLVGILILLLKVYEKLYLINFTDTWIYFQMNCFAGSAKSLCWLRQKYSLSILTSKVLTSITYFKSIHYHYLLQKYSLSLLTRFDYLITLFWAHYLLITSSITQRALEYFIRFGIYSYNTHSLIYQGIWLLPHDLLIADLKIHCPDRKLKNLNKLPQAKN